jgi:hypothetical protein
MPKDDEIEKAIQAASEAMDRDPRLKAKDAAIQYGAHYRRLLNRRNGHPPSSSRGGHNKKLSEPEEEAIKSYLDMLYHMGKAANKSTLIQACNSILRAQGSTDMVSRRWAND